METHHHAQADGIVTTRDRLKLLLLWPFPAQHHGAPMLSGLGFRVLGFTVFFTFPGLSHGSVKNWRSKESTRAEESSEKDPLFQDPEKKGSEKILIVFPYGPFINIL